MVKAIAYARVNTDKIDATILAKLHASGFLPKVWVADDETQRRRRQISERMAVLDQVVRIIKGRVQAILHANLIPKYDDHLVLSSSASSLVIRSSSGSSRPSIARSSSGSGMALSHLRPALPNMTLGGIDDLYRDG
jgi:hypothetical protein